MKPEVCYSFGSNFYITSCQYLYKIMITGEVLKFQFKLPKNIEFLIGLNNQLYAKAGVTFYLLDIVNRQINQVNCQPTFTSKILASVHQNDTKRPKCYIFDSQHIYEAALSQNQIVTVKIQDLLISDDKIKVYMYLHYILIILTNETLIFDTRGKIFRQCSIKFDINKNYAVINEFLVSSTGECYNFNNIMLTLEYRDQLHIAKIHKYNSYLQDIQLNLFDNVNGQITIGNGYISNQKEAFFTDQGLNCFFYRITNKNFQIHFYDQAFQFGFGALYCKCGDDLIVINQYNQVLIIKESRQIYQLCELPTEQFKPRAFAAGCEFVSGKIFIHGGLILESGETSDESFVFDVAESRLVAVGVTSEIRLHGHTIVKVKNKLLILYGSHDITYQNLNTFIFEGRIEQVKQPVSNNDKIVIGQFQQADYGMLRLGIYGFNCIYINKFLFIMGASMGFCQKEITDIIVFNLQDEEFKILQDKIYFAPYQKFAVINKQIVSTRQKFDYEKIIDCITFVKETFYTKLQTNLLQIKQNKKPLKNTDMLVTNISLEEYNKILQNSNSLLTNNIIQPSQVEIIGSGAILYFNVNNYQKFADVIDDLDIHTKMIIFDQLLQIIYFLGSIDIFINKKLWYDLYVLKNNLYLLPNECMKCESKEDYLKIINQIYVQIFIDQQLKFHSPFYQLYDLNYFNSLNINQSVKIIQNLEKMQDIIKASPRSNKYIYMITDINEMYTLKQYFTLFEIDMFNMHIRDVCKYIIPLQVNNVSFKPNKLFCPQFYYLLIDQNDYRHVYIVRKMHQILGSELKNIKDVLEIANYYQVHQDQCKLAYNLLQLNYFIDYSQYLIIQDDSSYLQKLKQAIPKFIIGLITWLAGTTKIYFKKGEKQCKLEVNSFFCAGKTEEQFLDLLTEWYCSKLQK